MQARDHPFLPIRALAEPLPSWHAWHGLSTTHLTAAQLEAGLSDVLQSPRDGGVLRMIVCRPNTGERQIIETGVLDLVQGLVGDNWKARGSSSTADGSADPERQLTVMNARVVALVAQNRSRWPLAGDQLYIDLDLSENNLPVGSRFALGSAVIEVTAPPHTGCKKFVARFGLPAMNFVNSSQGKQLHLRGINAKIVKAGTIRVGDVATKL